MRAGDIFMFNPKGSNERLNEAGENRGLFALP
jgi:hypothetical protein